MPPVVWAQGALAGKQAGIFVSTSGQGGGQETTAVNALSVLVHHGIIFVPLGYAKAFPLQTNLEEIHGGSPYGAGTFAGVDGSRQPTKLEKKLLSSKVNLSTKLFPNKLVFLDEYRVYLIL